MTTIVKVKFRSSTVKNSPGSIVYFVTHRRIVRQITTGYKIFPEEWDGRQLKVVPLYKERAGIIRQIAQKLAHDMKRMDAIIMELGNNGNCFMADDVVRKFQETGTNHTLFGFMNEVIKQLKHLGKVRTSETYTSTLYSFMHFRNNNPYLVMSECMERDSENIIQIYFAFWG